MKHCENCYDTGYINTLDTRFDKNVVERCDNCRRYPSDYAAQKAEIRKRERIITYDQWEQFYRPISDGSWYRDFQPYKALNAADKAVFDLALTEKRLWTEIIEDDCFTVIPGIAYVNRVAFYITEKPCHLNVTVEDPVDIQAIKVASADAKQLLLELDQNDYPFTTIWPEKTFFLDVTIVDDYRQPIEWLCRKYHRRLSDAIELSWY